MFVAANVSPSCAADRRKVRPGYRGSEGEFPLLCLLSYAPIGWLGRRDLNPQRMGHEGALAVAAGREIGKVKEGCWVSPGRRFTVQPRPP